MIPPAAWLVVSFVGCLFGAAADGAQSIIPNFLKYGLGVGLALTVLMTLAYLYDSRKLKGDD